METTSIKLCKYNKYVKYIYDENLRISVKYNIGHKLNLNKLSSIIKKYKFSYNQHIFAGMIIYYEDKLLKKRIKITLFPSGNIMLQSQIKCPDKIIKNAVNYINKIIYTKYLLSEKIKIKKIKISKNIKLL